MITLNIHQREARLLERVAELEEDFRACKAIGIEAFERIERLELGEKFDDAMSERLVEKYKESQKRIAELEAELESAIKLNDLMANQLQRWTNQIKGSADEPTDN